MWVSYIIRGRGIHLSVAPMPIYGGTGTLLALARYTPFTIIKTDLEQRH
jgi:hypothetical protein